jgi:hypothetical protein
MFLVRYQEGARSQERICVELADHEMQRKEHQSITHSNPLFEIMDE